MPNPSVEMASVGVQNRRTLSTLLLRRLASKKRAKDTTAISQHQGEKMLPMNVAAIAPNPTVFATPIGAISRNSGNNKAISIAAIPLSASHSCLHQLATAILLCRENSGRGLLKVRLAVFVDLSSMQACVAECSDRPAYRC